MMKATEKIPNSANNTRTDILKLAVPLFAAKGYNGVSMRDLSNAAELSVAAIYHHFQDKKTLYLEVLKYTFADKAVLVTGVINTGGTALERMELLLDHFTQLISSDPDFRALVLWELLDDDEERLRLVAEEVLIEPFNAMNTLMSELAPNENNFMLTMSLIWQVVSHFETAPMCRFLPGWKADYSDPKIISKHLMQLLKSSLKLN